MKGFVSNIEESVLANTDFRHVLYTTAHTQLVLMSLVPGEDIGEEVHDVDQFFRVSAGTGTVVLNGVTHRISTGSAIVIPAGIKHNISNEGESALKLYTLYMPPHHKDGTVHKTKAEASADHEHFDGVTSE